MAEIRFRCFRWRCSNLTSFFEDSTDAISASVSNACVAWASIFSFGFGPSADLPERIVAIRTQSLEKQLEAASRQQNSLEAALAEARKDYSAELDKSRQELRRTEERLEANEKRALLEIDHERQMTVKVQRELLQLRERSFESEDRQRNELAASKSELAETRQQLGIAEGKLAELKATNDQQIEALSALRQVQSKQETQLALAQREIELTQAAAKQFQESIASKPTITKVPRRNRKI